MKEYTFGVLLERVPPGDQWANVDDDIVAETLYDAFAYCVKTYGVTDFRFDVRNGIIFKIEEHDVAELVKQPKQTNKFDLYGEASSR